MSIRLLLPFLLAAVFGGCASFPEERPPEIQVSEKWKFQGTAPAGDTVETLDWIRAFGSHALVTMIEQCLQSSTTVVEADARLAAARAAMNDARSRLYPQLSFNGARTASGWLSSRGATGSGAAYTWTLSGAWDMDVWGEHRSSLRAAAYSVDAQRFAAIGARLDLISAVTSSFVQLSALRERLGIANKNLASALRMQGLIASRVAKGYAMQLDLAQQDVLVSTQRVAVASLDQQVGDSEIALARLLDVPPASMSVDVDSFEKLSIPDIGPGLPTQLLFRRPDVSQSEASLLAADANLQAARAAVFPGFSLGASLSNPGSNLVALFTAPVYTVAASVVATVFDGGHLQARREIAAAQKHVLLAEYRRSVVGAYADVESALNAVKQADDQATIQENAVRQARQVLALSIARHRAGGDTFLNVLDAQRLVFSQEDLAVQLRLSRLLAKVALFKSLGGGWSINGQLRTITNSGIPAALHTNGAADNVPMSESKRESSQ
ncbi:efflux transporter outer membrane subunit [Burkholderia ambifaria]|uniref:efflux transporter outer membrane subunit n=1 Tax=Burkholderia ambifaria TaxID=152480 RepID=UPI00158B45EC|nr:efflux transporter outer membrane subunit [Burkholderia ambifaria]QQJ96436.1 efflux transporter outer membrane subunit [Burkholderia ambifaria]